MNDLLQNITYIALFIASGIVILKTLGHFDMRIARTCFAVLFGVLLLYVPFYFGGRLAILISDLLYTDSMYAYIFVEYTLNSLVSSYVYVKFVSILTTLVAIIIAAAAIIVGIIIASKVAEIVKRYMRERRLSCVKSVKAIYPRVVYILNNQHIYKRLLHLLN